MPKTLKKVNITELLRQRRFAWSTLRKQQGVITRMWSKHCGLMEEHHRLQMRVLSAIQQLSEDPNPVKSVVEELKKNVECPVCMELIPNGSIKITSCGHKFCKTCLDKLGKCALCRNKLK